MSEILSLKRKLSNVKAKVRAEKTSFISKAKSQGYVEGHSIGYEEGLSEGIESGYRDGYGHAVKGDFPDLFVSKRKVAEAIRDFCGYHCPCRNNYIYKSSNSTNTIDTVEIEKYSCHSCPIFCLERFINEDSGFY